MSGICGVVEFDANNHVDEDLLKEMCRVTSHGSRLWSLMVFEIQAVLSLGGSLL